MSFEKTLNDTDLRALWDALYSTVKEPRAPYDWSATVAMYERVEAEFNLRSERAKNSVALVDVALGSIWVEVDEDMYVGCKWPTPDTDSGVSCSYSDDGPCWHPDPEQRVRVLATGLDAVACRWALNDTGLPVRVFSALVHHRCAHLMAGGSIESYVEAT